MSTNIKHDLKGIISTVNEAMDQIRDCNYEEEETKEILELLKPILEKGSKQIDLYFENN